MLLDWEKWLCFKKGLFSNTISTRTLLQPRLTVLYTPSRKDRNLVSCTLPNTIESHENYWFVIKICIFQILNLNKILLVYFKMSRSFFFIIKHYFIKKSPPETSSKLLVGTSKGHVCRCPIAKKAFPLVYFFSLLTQGLSFFKNQTLWKKRS